MPYLEQDKGKIEQYGMAATETITLGDVVMIDATGGLAQGPAAGAGNQFVGFAGDTVTSGATAGADTIKVFTNNGVPFRKRVTVAGSSIATIGDTVYATGPTVFTTAPGTNNLKVGYIANFIEGTTCQVVFQAFAGKYI